MPPREIVYRAPRFHIERVIQTTPDGREHEREIVRHPGAVVILPILPDGRVVFVKNFRVAVDETLIELPAGTLDHDEPPLETARAGTGRGNRLSDGEDRARC